MTQAINSAKVIRSLATLYTAVAKAKVKPVPLSDIVVDLDLNPRDAKGHDYDSIPGLQSEIQEHGQLSEIVTHTDSNGREVVIQGNRRMLALKGDPTLKIVGLNETYPNGYEDEVTGEVRKFDTVLAKHIDATDDEAAALRRDHGNVEPQSKVGFIKMLWSECDRNGGHTGNGIKEKVLMSNRGIIDQRWPLDAKAQVNLQKKIEEQMVAVPKESPNYLRQLQKATKNAYLATRHGKWQEWAEIAYNAPKVVQAAYLEHERGNQAWPTPGELKMAVKTFQDLQSAAPGNILTQEEPGQDFLDYWTKVVEAKSVTDENGNAVRSTSAMTGNEIRKLPPTLNSLILRIFTYFILRDPRLPTEGFKPFIALAASAEKDGMTEDNRKRLDMYVGLLNAKPAVETVGK